MYLKRNATIVDTTNTEPHYWLVTEPPDKPFERRRYTFNTIEDVDSFWFDLMCICLNTPLGKNLNNQSGLCMCTCAFDISNYISFSCFFKESFVKEERDRKRKPMWMSSARCKTAKCFSNWHICFGG